MEKIISVTPTSLNSMIGQIEGAIKANNMSKSDPISTEVEGIKIEFTLDDLYAARAKGADKDGLIDLPNRLNLK